MRISEYAGMTVGIVGAGVAVACSIASAPVAVPVGLAAGYCSGKITSAVVRPCLAKVVGNAVAKQIASNENTEPNEDTGWNPFKWARKQVTWAARAAKQEAQNQAAELAGRKVEKHLGNILDAIDKGEKRMTPVHHFLTTQLEQRSGVNIKQTVSDALRENGKCCCPGIVREKIATWAAEEVVPIVADETVGAAVDTSIEVTARTITAAGRVYNAGQEAYAIGHALYSAWRNRN